LLAGIATVLPDGRYCRDSGAWMAKREGSQVSFLDLGGQFPADIAGVDDSTGFEQGYHGLGVGTRAVLDAARHEKAALSEHGIMISHPDGDGELSVEAKENSPVPTCRFRVNSPWTFAIRMS
jgi:hypothetical protein